MAKLCVIWLFSVALALWVASDGWVTWPDCAALALAFAVFCAFAGQGYAVERIVGQFGRRG